MIDDPPANDGIDPITAAWANQEEPDDDIAYLQADPSALVDSVAKAHRKDQRRLLWLNVREVLPTPFIAGVFAVSATNAAHPLAMLAASVLVLCPASFLLVKSIQHHRADGRWGTSVRDQLARRLDQVKYGAWLLRTVGWWYFLPFAVAIMLFRYGSGPDEFTSEDPIALGVIVVFLSLMYWLNRRIGRAMYESEVERFEALLADFDRTP